MVVSLKYWRTVFRLRSKECCGFSLISRALFFWGPDRKPEYKWAQRRGCANKAVMRGMTLLEAILALALMVAIAGGVLVALRTVLEASVHVARARATQDPLNAWNHVLRASFRNLQAEARFTASGPSDDRRTAWRMLIEEPGAIFAFGWGGVGRQRLIVEAVNEPPSRSWVIQLIAIPRVTPSGFRPTPLVLLSDIDSTSVRYYDVRSRSWVEVWGDASFRPTVVEVRIERRQGAIGHAVVEMAALPPAGN